MANLITDSIDLPLDADGDLDVFAPLTSGLAGVAQSVRVRLLLFKGEWFANLDAGIPYLPRDGVTESEAILGQRFSDTKIRAAFRTAILSAPSVTSLPRLDVTFDAATRTLRVSWRAITTFGDTTDSLELAT